MNFFKQLNLKLLTSFLLLVFVIVCASAVKAQTSTPSAETVAKYNITFPIEELGNCESASACREYCEDPVNRASCVSFAKAKGFYKENSEAIKKAELLEKAKTELGCDSPESCKALCELEENFEKCSAFAKENNLQGGHHKDTKSNETLAKAKEALGCDSPDSCKTFCEQEENEEKCNEFAKKNNFRGGERKSGPGGCTTEETCKAFCSVAENFELCSNFQILQGKQGFTGPGGCDSPDSCKSYCEDHTDECKKVEVNKEEVCKKTPQCIWQNDTCSCKSFAGATEGDNEEVQTFCSANTDKCENGQPKVNPQEYCQRYPGRCEGGVDPKKRCTQQGSCQWSDEDNVCKCRQDRDNSGSDSSSSGEFNQNKQGERKIIAPSLVMNKEEMCKLNPEKCARLSGTPPAISPVFNKNTSSNVPPQKPENMPSPPKKPEFRKPEDIKFEEKKLEEKKLEEQKPEEDKSDDQNDQESANSGPSVQGVSDNGRIPLINFLRLLFR